MNKKVEVFYDGLKYFILNKKEKIYMKPITNIIQPQKFVEYQRKIKLERIKSASFRKMMNQKVDLVNKKIPHLNKIGQNI